MFFVGPEKGPLVMSIHQSIIRTRQADWPSISTPTGATRGLYEPLQWLCLCGTSPQDTTTSYFLAPEGLCTEWPSCASFSWWTYLGRPSLDGSPPICTHGSRYIWACCRQQVVLRNDPRAPGGTYLYPPVVPFPVNSAPISASVSPVNPFIRGPPIITESRHDRVNITDSNSQTKPS